MEPSADHRTAGDAGRVDTSMGEAPGSGVRPRQRRFRAGSPSASLRDEVGEAVHCCGYAFHVGAQWAIVEQWEDDVAYRGVYGAGGAAQLVHADEVGGFGGGDQLDGDHAT